MEAVNTTAAPPYVQLAATRLLLANSIAPKIPFRSSNAGVSRVCRGHVGVKFARVDSGRRESLPLELAHGRGTAGV